jgi:hypothetical protein
MEPDDLRGLAKTMGRKTRKVADRGTRARYVNAKCRCLACVQANSRYESARRAAKASPRRECQALGPRSLLCRQPAREGSIFCAFHALPGYDDETAA